MDLFGSAVCFTDGHNGAIQVKTMILLTISPSSEAIME